MFSTHAWLSLLSLLQLATAQSDCVGDTLTYNQSGLVVPFKNLCNKDISAPVDFRDPTNEPSRAYCLMRCVQKAPLCYGFDFAYPGGTNINCYLMQSPFPESSALYDPKGGNAAMLDPLFVAGLSSSCLTAGLYGCFTKNGQVQNSSSRTTSTIQTLSTTASITSTVSDASGTTSGSSSTLAPASRNNDLSPGAKAGIGVGVGVAGLLVIIGAVVLLLRRRRKSSTQIAHEVPAPPYAMAKASTYAHRHHDVELPADHTHARSELESPPVEHFVGRPPSGSAQVGSPSHQDVARYS
ncbi:hypothetical protein ACEQ8H_001226 [Pleosporales sp. CAS-2024a]